MTLRYASGAVLMVALAIGSPATADGMSDPFGRDGYGRPSGVHHPSPRRWVAPRRGYREGPGSIAIEAASYGPPPPPGVALHGHHGPILVELHEPYLPRGVLYNVPPRPVWSGGWAGRAVRALN